MVSITNTEAKNIPQRSIDEWQVESLRMARIGKRDAKTALGRKLWEIRERAIVAGEPLVDLEDIERELDR